MRRRGGRRWVPATWPFDVWYPRGRIVHRCKRNLGTGIDDNQNTKTKRTAQQRGMFTRRSKRENLKEWKCVQYAFYTSYAASMSINQIVYLRDVHSTRQFYPNALTRVRGIMSHNSWFIFGNFTTVTYLRIAPSCSWTRCCHWRWSLSWTQIEPLIITTRGVNTLIRWKIYFKNGTEYPP